MKAERTWPEPDPRVSPAAAVPAAPPSEDPVLDELSRKMQAWSQAWFGFENSEAAIEQSQIRRRLLFWLKRCIGGDAGAVLANPSEDLSLAKSTPLLTAFLGRRAMVEVSRRVLNDE